MIKSLVRGKEIAVGVVNDVGALAKVTSLLVNHGINIETVMGYSTARGEQAELMFITDNNFKAVEVLVEHGYSYINEHDVIIAELENKPGALKNISEILALQQINITYIYATTCNSGCPAKLVFATSNNDDAFKMLKMSNR